MNKEELNDMPIASKPIELDDAKMKKVDTIISWVLRSGVFTSFVIVLLGLVVTFTQHGSYLSSHAQEHFVLTKAYQFPHSIGSVASGLNHFDGISIVVLGLLVLLLTPISMIAVSILTFVYQRDRIFVGVTSFVLVVLLVSFLLGKAGGG